MGLGISKSEFRMMAILLSGAFLAVLSATLLTSALPTIMEDFAVSSTTVQWLTSGYALTEAVVIPLSAFLMGRISTRRLFIGGLSLFGCGSLVAALAPTFPVLLAGRVMQAAATGFVMPMVFSVVLLIIPREKRGSAMGIVGLIIGFAPTIGPSLSGVLVDTMGWRAIFGIVAFLAIFIMLLAAKELKPYGEFHRTKFDAPSVLLSTLGLVSLLYGLSSFSSAENRLTTATLVVAGIVLVGLYAHRQLHLDEPMLRIDILKVSQYRTVVVVIALLQAALVGMETIMPLYIQGVLNQSATVSGLTLLPGAVIGAFTGLLSGRLFDKFGVRVPVLAGASIIALGLAGFVSFRADSPIVFVSIAYAVMSVGIQFTMTPVNTWGVNSLPNEAIQHAQSTSNTINQVAGSFGTALLVSIAAAASNATNGLAGVERTFFGYHASFCATAALAAGSIVLIVLFVRNKKHMSSESEERSSEVPANNIAEPAANAIDDGPSLAFTRIADKALSSLTLAETMNPNAATIYNTATMGDVVNLIAETDTTGVSVIDKSGNLVGYVTDGDIVRYLSRIELHVSNPSAGVSVSMKDDEALESRIMGLTKLNVMELATKRVVSVEVETPLDVACGILAKRKIKKVPITQDGKLVGALSRRNVLHAIITSMETVGAGEN